MKETIFLQKNQPLQIKTCNMPKRNDLVEVTLKKQLFPELGLFSYFSIKLFLFFILNSYLLVWSNLTDDFS